jgi:hypothetical protein
MASAAGACAGSWFQMMRIPALIVGVIDQQDFDDIPHHRWILDDFLKRKSFHPIKNYYGDLNTFLFVLILRTMANHAISHLQKVFLRIRLMRQQE